MLHVQMNVAVTFLLQILGAVCDYLSINSMFSSLPLFPDQNATLYYLLKGYKYTDRSEDR